MTPSDVVQAFRPAREADLKVRTTSCKALLLLSTVCLAACGRPVRPDAPLEIQPNILLVTIDTLRADRLGTGVTPTIDRLAASGVRFTAARTAVPLTLPSHATVMTGLLPPAHGVRENGVDRLDDRHATVARLLKAAGYQTAAVVGAFVLDRRFGLGQGFDSYDDQIPRDPSASDRLEAERPASAVIDRALAWLGSRPNRSGPPDQPGRPGQPFFLWIHLYDPHAPYTPPPEFRGRTRTAYDDEVMYADAQLGRVVEWIGSHRLADRTLIIVAGDHGEGLGEHGERTHGMLLYDSTLRVPLIVVEPGGAAGARSSGTRRDDPVSLADLAPTILRAAGVTAPADIQGRDLFSSDRPKPNAVAAGASRDRDVYAETEYPRSAGWSPLQALTDGRWKTIRGAASIRGNAGTTGPGGSEVYDLQNDPAEQHDVAAAQQGLARGMSSRLDALYGAGSSAPSSRVVSGEAAERLRALGYVASSSSATPAASSGALNPRATIAAWNEFEDALDALNAKRPQAVALLERLVDAHPESPLFQSMYARALGSAGKTDAALAAYRAAVKRWPADATLLHDLSVAARDAAGVRQSRALRDEAERAEQAALALAPESAAAHNGLGLIAVDAQRPRDAVREFERATTLDPNNASYWTNLGNARRASGDRTGAETAYRQALAIDAGAVDALNGLGVLLVETTRAAEATQWFERAIAAAPGFVEARLNLGIALQQAGDAKRAAEAYRAVLRAPAGHTREKRAAATLLAALGSR